MSRLDRYIGGQALKFFLLAAAVLVSLFSLLEFVDQLRFVGHGRYDVGDALTYVALTVPFRALELAPVSMLLATLLALGTLARHSELLILQSFGVSETEVIAPVLKLAVPVVAALFLLAQFVIPPAQMLAQSLRTQALSASESLNQGTMFWAHSGNQYLSVQRFEYSNILKDVEIYEFSPQGRLRDILHAEEAFIRPGGTWLLFGVEERRFDGVSFTRAHYATKQWTTTIPTDLLVLPPESMPPLALYAYVRGLHRRHQQALRYEQELWVQASLPLTVVGMILLATPFVFGLPRSQSSGRLLAIGAVLGVVFTLAQQITWHLALLLDLNPMASALAPSLALMTLAAALFGRLRRL